MIITLEQAKKNLNIYFELPEGSEIVEDYDDEIVQRCINSAIAYVEQYTDYALNYVVKTVYTNNCGVVDLVTYPFEVMTDDVKVERRALSSVLRYKPNTAIDLIVGYDINGIGYDGEQPPAQLIEACYKLITYFYENRDMYKWDIPTDVQMLLNPLRRSATV